MKTKAPPVAPPVAYKEYTVRRNFRRATIDPEKGVVISDHATLAEAKKALTPETYILNEVHGFTILPGHYGIPSASLPARFILCIDDTEDGDDDEASE